MNMGETDRCSVLKRKPSPALGAVFGANVRRLRAASLITKVDFAKRCGVGRPYLDKVERGEANPTLEYLERFAAALGVDPLCLLTSQPLRSWDDASIASLCHGDDLEPAVMNCDDASNGKPFCGSTTGSALLRENAADRDL